MALPSSGPLTFANIQTEFGGSNPISLSEYYAGGGLVPAGTSGTYGAVPSSGAIGVQSFYGTSNVSGWYYFMAPSAGNGPRVRGMQPISNGNLLGTMNVGNSNYAFALNTTGAVVSCTVVSTYGLFIGFMNEGNAHAFANDNIPMFYKFDTKGIARLATDATLIQPITWSVNQGDDLYLGGSSPSTYQAYYNRANLFNSEYGYYYQNWVMLNFANNTAVTKYYAQQGQDNYWGRFLDGMSLTDSTWSYALVSWSGSPSGSGLMKFNKTTGALDGSNGFHIGGMAGAFGFVSDPSGNMYISAQTGGRIARINSSITAVNWCNGYSESGATGSDTYIAYYDGYLYAVQDQRSSTGTLLMKLNPSNGSVVWSVRINNTFLLRVDGISVTANGIVVSGRNNAATPYGVILNYPIAGGLFGSFNSGELVITSVTASASAVSSTITNPGYPSFTTDTSSRGTTNGNTLNATSFPYSRSTY